MFQSRADGAGPRSKHGSGWIVDDCHMRTGFFSLPGLHTGKQQLTYGSCKKLMWGWQLAGLITAPLML